MDATDSFISIFDNLTDPRIDRQKRHKLIDILVITLCATICGADSWLLIEEFGKARKDWLGEFLELPNGIPSHDTFRVINGNTTVERRYYISSILTDAEKFGSAVRQHWGVENNVHWTMDVIFNEDKTLQHSGNSAENMASIRRLALNLLKKHSARKTIKAKKMLAALNVSYLEEIIFS